MVGRIYDAALAPDAERIWLDGLRDMLGAEHAVLARLDASGEWWCCSRLASERRDRIERVIDEATYRAALACLPAMTATRMSRVVPTRQLRQTDFYQELIRPMGGGVAAAFKWSGGHDLHALMVCRSAERDGQDFSEPELRLLQWVLPHLAGATRLRAEMAQCSRALAEALEVLNLMDSGVVIVDPGGLRFANRAAESIARAGGLRLDRSGLHAARPGDEQRLQRLLKGSAAPLPGRGKTADTDAGPPRRTRIAIAREPPGRPLLVTALPASILDAGHGSSPPDRVLLLITDPDRAARASADVLAAAYGLTPREAGLALALANGLPLHLAALNLGITLGTARQYLKAVFSKTATGRQAELVRLVLQDPG